MQEISELRKEGVWLQQGMEKESGGFCGVSMSRGVSELPEIVCISSWRFGQPQQIMQGLKSHTAGYEGIFCQILIAFLLPYRGTLLIRNRTLLGPYRRPMPRVLGGSWGGGRFIMGEVPLYPQEPPYVLDLLPTVGPMDHSRWGCSRTAL